MKIINEFKGTYCKNNKYNLNALKEKFKLSEDFNINKKYLYLSFDKQICSTSVSKKFIEEELKLKRIVFIDGFWYYKEEIKNDKEFSQYLIKFKTKKDNEWSYHVPDKKFISKKSCLKYLQKNNDNNCIFEVLTKLK